MTTSLLMIVSFVVANVSLKQMILANSYEESQYAFYNAESGLECAQYWDFEMGGSQFDTATTTGRITCGGQIVTTGSQTISPPGSGTSLIGGGGVGNPTSIFSISFDKGCAIVRVTKELSGDTTIDSRGYNDCTTGYRRRVERGVELSY